MSCNNGIDREMLRLMIEAAIRSLIADGTIQGGLRGCDNAPLPAGRQIPECSALDAIRQPAKDTYLSKLDIVGGVVLQATLTDGSVVQVDLPAPPQDKYVDSGAITGTDLVLTRSDGEQVKIDLCGWRGAQPCEYFPTLQVPVDRKCPMVRNAFIYHPEDLRDPAADNRLLDCDGNLVGFLYSTKAYPQLIELEVDGQLIGYASPAPMVRVWNEDCCRKQP